MSAATRFDAPLLLGRVVKHPMSLIEDTFDAVPFDRGIREGFVEILGAMTQPGFDALTYPPPASESPRFGPRDPVVGAVYPSQGCAMTFPAGQLLPDAPLTYVERGLLIHGDRLLVIAPVGGGGESAEVSHKVIVNISPDEYGALDSAAQESLLAQLEADPPEAATRETAREFHDLVARTHLAAQGLWPYNLEHRDVEQFTRFDAPLMLGVADRVRPSPNLAYFNAVPFDRPIRDGVVEVLNLMRTPGFEPLRYPPMRGYDPENETDGPGVVKGAVLPSIGAALSFEAGDTTSYIEHGLIVDQDRLYVLAPVSEGHSREVGYRVLVSVTPAEYDAMTPAQVDELFLAIEATPIEALNDSLSDEFHDRVNKVYLQELEAVASTKDPAAENHVSYRDATSSIEM